VTLAAGKRGASSGRRGRAKGTRVRAATNPHAVLAGSAAVAVAAEVATQKTGSSVWIVLAAAIAFAAFVAAWRLQDRLRLLPLLGLTVAFSVASIAVHLRLGVTSFDSSDLYRLWGNALLDARYPESMYPPGAVLLFALDAWLGGGATRTSHAFVMIPFQLLTVTAVWALRTRTTPWLAALVALWPMNAFFWEFRFDLVPAALLALGLLLAFRERWALSGIALGLGAATKWTPGLAVAALAVWLLASGRKRPFAVHVIVFASVFIVAHLPFLVWSPGETLYAYEYFSDQGLTGESLWYLLLAALGLASVDVREPWLPADVPTWADSATVVIQTLVLLALGLAAVRARASLRAGVAIAAMAPVLFLLTNRVFSPQYLVLMLAAWAIAGAVLVETRREQLALGVAAMAATTANTLVYPHTLFELGLWRLASAVLFSVGVATSVWIVVHAVRLAATPAAGSPAVLARRGLVAGASRGER
jgi:glycosyl transferase family 87